MISCVEIVDSFRLCLAKCKQPLVMFLNLKKRNEAINEDIVLECLNKIFFRDMAIEPAVLILKYEPG